MAYKQETKTTTLGAAVGDAFSEIQCLRDEMQETVDNMSGANMEHLPKYETANDALSELENHCDDPDVPGSLAEIPVTYVESVNKNKRRPNSRDVRLSNAQSMIQAVLDKLDELIEGKAGPETAKASAEDAESLRQELDEHADFSVDFPGFFG